MRNTRKTPLMLAIESQYGKPIETLLVELYRTLGGQEEVGKALGVDTTTVHRWMDRYDLPRRQWVIVEDKADVA